MVSALAEIIGDDSSPSFPLFMLFVFPCQMASLEYA
jgi:hypothetical protein